MTSTTSRADWIGFSGSGFTTVPTENGGYGFALERASWVSSLSTFAFSDPDLTAGSVLCGAIFAKFRHTKIQIITTTSPVIFFIALMASVGLDTPSRALAFEVVAGLPLAIP